MKKILLIVIFFILTGSVFAGQNGLLGNNLNDNNQIDSTKIKFYNVQNLKLYPNPASTYLFIEYDVIFVKEAKLQIYNSIGAIVYTKLLKDKKEKIKVSVSQYKNGLYFCSLQVDGRLLNTKKILINH